MLTEIDLDAAAAKGIISEDQAITLRNFEAKRAASSLSMAEKFQIYGGLTDITMALGLAMALMAVASILGEANFSLLYLLFPPALLFFLRKIQPPAQSGNCRSKFVRVHNI